MSESTDENDNDIDADTLLASICLEAHTNADFNAESVREILENAGQLGLWEAAAEMAESDEDEDEDEDDEEEDEDEDEEDEETVV